MSPKQLFALFLLNLLNVSIYSQQLNITDTYTEQQLVEDFLVQGCVEISNIESNVNGEVNDIKSFGYFEKASSNFPFQNGIILSTGRAVSGANGTNAAVLNEGQNTWRTDPDLENALGISGTVNATSIEFDFISIANQISFNYILASEEYFGNFPCEYSDGFALLIRPADGSEPYQNIALIPGTNIPVNTKTIHDEIVGFCEAENEEYFEGYNLGDTNFNGRTAVMTANASIVPNVKYHIKLVIADQSDKNYDSAVFIEGNSFNAIVELGDDITTCAEVETIYADIGNPEATYSWYKNGSQIQGETGSELTVENSGDYSVKVVLPFLDGTCTIEDSIVINLSSTQTAEELRDFELCDDLSRNGKEIFDLSLKTDEVLESVPDSEYEVSYHYSLVDAELGQNSIDQPIENSTNPQTIYVRIRDIDNGCLAYSDFKLVVNELPNLNPVYDYFACDDLTADGTVSIDLDSYNNLLTNGNDNLSVSYHNNLSDAQSGNNPLQIPYTNSARSETLYAYVLNELTGCSATTEIYLEVKDNPIINEAPVYIDACDQQHDGFSTFDLTSVINEITNGQAGVEITFHTTRDDADFDLNPILQPETYQNEVSEKQSIFIRVEDSETGCATVRSFEIHSNLLLTATNIRDFSLCEVGDGANAFDLVKIAEIIMNNLEGVEIVFYESPSDRANSQNAINTNADYIPEEFPTRLYITLESDICLEIAEFDLLLNPSFNFGETNVLDYCIPEGENMDTIDLSTLDSTVLNGQNGYIVTYYETQDDADNQRNALPNEYQGWSVPQSIFARIQVPESDCFDIVPFELNVESAPTIEQPSNIAICDYNGQGTATINLEEKISEIVDNPTDFIIQFFESLESADANTDAISNISEYATSSKEIFVRVDKPDGGCPSVTSFNIYVNNTPQIQQISDFEHCEYNTDYIGDFIFSEKDQEITQGDNGLEVLYFLNSQDAEDGSNPIDKESVYNNTSNPQTIYYRVQHKTDSSCYNTSSFQIVVGTSPEYNKPTDLFLCDDISNDQREMFDLSIALNEIKNGISEDIEVSFHTTRNNAENGISPLGLQFTNTANPQTIFVRIGNGNICNVYTSFELNVVQVPDANEPPPLVVCDINEDESVSFNLEDALIDILDVRQNNIVVSYFKSESDAEANLNPITNPTNFQNTSNPQTVYVRLTNTVSGCFSSIPLELLVTAPPSISYFEDQTICATEDKKFDLNIFNSELVEDTSNLSFFFFRNETDAIANQNQLEMPYRYRAPQDNIVVRVEDNYSGCFSLNPFTLNVNPLPIANKPSDLITCDDDYDGFYKFNLESQIPYIIGNQSAEEFNVKFYVDYDLAIDGGEDLGSTYEAIDQEIIYARVANKNTGCFRLTDFTLFVNPLPEVDIPDQALCPERPTLHISANTNKGSDTYLWSTGETTPEIEVTNIGSYWVTVTSRTGCTTTESFNIIESAPANIDVTEVVDFSDPNNITVTISGIGNYLYQLDNDEPQESNVFERVTMGYHTLTIIDLNGCASVSKEVLVIDTPKFMTPNGDGYWDCWHIVGIETLPGTIVKIFDRYGKQLATLQSTDKGWDGNYNGRPMPATDYWFVADVKQGGFDFQVTGHFALRR